MGVEFDGIGGIGIYADDYRDEFLKTGLLDEGLDLDKKTVKSISEKLGVRHEKFGSLYSGCLGYVFLISGSNLKEINQNAEYFIEAFGKHGIVLTEESLEIIVEGLIS